MCCRLRPSSLKLQNNQRLTAQHGVQQFSHAAPFLLQHKAQQNAALGR
jgi:hypothetical protein